MNRWENSLYYQRTFAPALWPSVLMVQQAQLSDAQIMTLGTAPVSLLTGPTGYFAFPERVLFMKPTSSGAYSGVGVTGNLQVGWPDASNFFITLTTAGLLDTALSTWGLSAQSVTAQGPATFAAFGYTGKNDGVNTNFQRISVRFATANPVVSGGGILNIVMTYRLFPFIPAFP